MEDLTGKQFGPYQIVEPLGEGGMAAVYKAYQPATDRYVALKVLPRHLADDPQFAARFQREAKLLAGLQHPHILPVFDYGQADGYSYIVMPLVPSGTLADLLKRHPLSLSHIRLVITQVGAALGYAHSRGLIHRDVKPSNVLIDEMGNCLLTDFGLSRMVEPSVSLTTSGAVVGTPAYMSPEQGMGRKVDRRTDIYSLGVILYEMATGRVPYRAETPMAVIIKHIQDPLPPPRTLNPDLPDAVQRVILKALSKTPDDRFQTAAEMVEAIRAAIPESPTPFPRVPVAVSSAETIRGRASQESVSATQAMPQRRLRAAPIMAAVAALAVLLLAIGGVLWNGFGGTRPSPTQAPILMVAYTETLRSNGPQPAPRTATTAYSAPPTGTSSTSTETPLATRTVTTPAANLPAPILYLAFDGDIADHSGETHATRSTGTIDFVPGIHGQAAYFDGSGEAVEVQAISMSRTPIEDEMTLEFWVELRAWQNPSPQSSGIESIASCGGLFYVDVEEGSWRLNAGIMTDNESETPVRAGQVRPGRWHHIALVYSGSQGRVKLFLDGEMIREQIATGRIPITDAIPFTVGTWYEQSGAFAGLVDELRLYSVALGDDVIRELARPASLALTPTVAHAAPSSTPAIGQNLLDNPSFEQDPATSGIPWFADARNTDLFAEWTNRRARTGQRALLLRASASGQAGWPGWETAPIPIPSGYTFLFSAWAQTPDGADAWLDVEFLDADGLPLTAISTGCEPIGVAVRPEYWEDLLSVSFTRSDVPSATHVILGLRQCLTRTEGRATELFYDDVFFGLVSP